MHTFARRFEVCETIARSGRVTVGGTSPTPVSHCRDPDHRRSLAALNDFHGNVHFAHQVAPTAAAATTAARSWSASVLPRLVRRMEISLYFLPRLPLTVRELHDDRKTTARRVRLHVVVVVELHSHGGA
ncbi:hypothetical protein DIJ64_08885 [Mycobacterium leprae]|uniref:Uncharacterized protein n=1 Tax=Mycobacterium leprae TaxID=1769 RepID=A0AAD0KSG3_MYCLR|nr:hypothetical protein DIJ64_08885 [Mycobacterium leprae]OAR21638.1 hypothetical protein A8144_05145 [Mycobacterium leprae 3125609]OAX71794.1 hypothetical protein A3216_03865 [Mycobacterium leprae 7935681]